MALAWTIEQARTCSGCGLPRSETFDPDNEANYEGVVLACHACAAKDRAVRRLDVTDGVYSAARRRSTHRLPKEVIAHG